MHEGIRYKGGLMKVILKIVLIILVVCILLTTYISKLNVTKREYDRLVIQHNSIPNQISNITEEDLDKLPQIVQDYLHYVGVVGSPKVYRYEVEMTGEMKLDETKEFSPVTILQTSTVNPDVRLFYMDMTYNGLKISGLHHYEDEQAIMKVKILDVFKVVDEAGEYMDQAETVTIFNDMCLLAPGSLIDDRIEWTEIDSTTVEASFTNKEITIHATLYFASDGRLINFISNDRYAIIDGTPILVPWSTPISEYHIVNGLNLPYKGKAIWHFTDYDFTYITLTIEDVTYN